MIEEQEVKITTTGSAGSATGSGTISGAHGFLLDVWLNYHASAPASTDVTITNTKDGDTILSVPNTATDVRVAPRQALWVAGAAVTAYGMYPLNQQLTVAVAGCNALTDALVAKIRYWRP